MAHRTPRALSDWEASPSTDSGIGDFFNEENLRTSTKYDDYIFTEDRVVIRPRYDFLSASPRRRIDLSKDQFIWCLKSRAAAIFLNVFEIADYHFHHVLIPGCKNNSDLERMFRPFVTATVRQWQRQVLDADNIATAVSPCPLITLLSFVKTDKIVPIGF